VNVQEVRQLDGYLKKLFGTQNIRVVPKGSDSAEVFVGEDDLGELTVDDEEGERSYNFRMVIQVGNDPSIQPVPTLNAYLRSKFENDNIRVVPRPKKTDSLEVYMGEEFIAVLFLEIEKGRRSYILELPILDVDLVDG
jgi:DNA-binding transcriptional regulator LsrR (DeoR family)